MIPKNQKSNHSDWIARLYKYIWLSKILEKSQQYIKDELLYIQANIFVANVFKKTL